MNGPKYRVEQGFGLFSVWVYSDRAIATHLSEEQARAIAKELNSEHENAQRFRNLYRLSLAAWVTPEDVPYMAQNVRYIVKWNGVGYAVHDTAADWNVSVHLTPEEAETARAALEALT